MLGRRQINATVHNHAPLRSSLADAAFAVEERVVWGGADVLRRAFEVVKWPFERVAWSIERWLIWPVEERSAKLSGPAQAAGVAALALFAVGAGVAGLLWASGSGGSANSRQAAAPTEPPVIRQTTEEAIPSTPRLQGARPDFTARAKSANGGALATKGVAPAAGAAAAKSVSSATKAKGSQGAPASVAPAGPPATAVAHRFAGAFVRYETGQSSAGVRTTFVATATPQLTRELLHRPPRLPAGGKVPQAKVVNVVAGPHRGDTYVLSVSLLRVGVTSELRLEMERDAKSGEWQVVRVLG
jgi:hypothetical protein